MVAGGDLKAFWDVYHEIHDRPHIRQLLETYRIGNLSAADAAAIEAEGEGSFGDAYGADPPRPRAAELRIPSTRPWNSEPQPAALVEAFYTVRADLLVISPYSTYSRLTPYSFPSHLLYLSLPADQPNELFFVRNHNPVPLVDESEWELEIESNESCGLAGRTYTLAELKTRFQRHEVVSVMQCAGNRQEDFVGEERPLCVARSDTAMTSAFPSTSTYSLTHSLTRSLLYSFPTHSSTCCNTLPGTWRRTGAMAPSATPSGRACACATCSRTAGWTWTAWRWAG